MLSCLRTLAMAVLALLAASAVRAEPAGSALEQPVSWTSWSADLFTRAKAQNRLVILDLEAVWCHWCHVMDAKTYGDPRIRALVGERFIAVRADQDANPDLAGRYGDWGWPATIVFAPDGTEIAKLQGYVEPDALLALLRAAVADPTPGPSVEAALAVTPADRHGLDPDRRKRWSQAYDASYDPRHGGWGEPLKYIDADSFDLALSLAEDGDKRAEARARQTLDRALALIDPVWGGVYQYSDALDWSSPHFEKIMAFQAQSLRHYSHAYARWQSPRHREAARAIKTYLTGFLMSPEGAFYTSQDADLNRAVDGNAFYALGDAARREKGMPRIDTNLYARENGWAIGALAAYAGAFDDAGALETARRAARWVVANRALPGGGFSHGARDRGGPFLGDSLATGQAFLDLHAATGEREWLDHAQGAAGFIAAHFHSESGGFANAARGETGEGTHAKPFVAIDEQVPAIRFLNLLSHYTGKAEQRALAEHGMRYLIAAVDRAEYRAAGALLADRELAEPPTHLTIVGRRDAPQSRDLFAMARALPAAHKRLEWWDPREGPLANPDVEYPDMGEPAAFACSGRFCSAPSFSAAELKAALAQMATVGKRKPSSEPAR